MNIKELKVKKILTNFAKDYQKDSYNTKKFTDKIKMIKTC
jgi:hypothetical protein